MINVLAVERKVLTMLDKKKSNKILWNYVDQADGSKKLYITYDGHALYVIPATDWYIDLSKSDRVPCESIAKMLTENGEDAWISNEMRKVDKFTVTKVQSVNSDKYAWIDTALLKDFGKIANYKVNSPIDPVFLYNDLEECIGLVLPVKYIGG